MKKKIENFLESYIAEDKKIEAKKLIANFFADVNTDESTLDEAAKKFLPKLKELAQSEKAGHLEKEFHKILAILD